MLPKDSRCDQKDTVVQDSGQPYFHTVSVHDYEDRMGRDSRWKQLRAERRGSRVYGTQSLLLFGIMLYFY